MLAAVISSVTLTVQAIILYIYALTPVEKGDVCEVGDPPAGALKGNRQGRIVPHILIRVVGVM